MSESSDEQAVDHRGLSGLSGLSALRGGVFDSSAASATSAVARGVFEP